MSSSPSLDALLQRCESEQLHLSGAIQPFGALLRIATADGLITHASANLARFIGVEAADIVGQSLKVLPWLTEERLAELSDRPGSTLVIQNVPQNTGGQLDGVVIRGEGCMIIELESNVAVADPIPMQQFQSPLLSVPGDEDEFLLHHHLLVRAFRIITGYDRIMIYRFDDDWSGEVIAEETVASMGSYMGLRFPASDIPAIARNLYMVNPARMIPDAKAPPVPLVSMDATAPDLTWSDLRSVSPVHLEYLANMGVGASFSVPVRVSRRLWGLVACHHLSPRLLSPDQRAACVSLANAYSLGLTSYQAGRRLQAIDSLDRRIEKILNTLAQLADPLDGIGKMGDRLIEAMAAQGFAMAVGNDVVITGAGPDLERMAVLDHWFMNECREMVVVTDHLENIFPNQLLLLAVVSGMVAIKARSVRSGWIRFYWFRPAQQQEVAWAGNPNKPVVEKDGAVVLSPRRSFEKWIEVKAGYSRPWGTEEKMTAAKFRNTLLHWL